ncbi:MAG: hypothetical protein V4487_07745 [Chlamydiota bacterium]
MGKIAKPHHHMSHSQLITDYSKLQRALRAAVRKIGQLEKIIEQNGTLFAENARLGKENTSLSLDNEILNEDWDQLYTINERLGEKCDQFEDAKENLRLENVSLKAENFILKQASVKTRDMLAQSLPVLTKAKPLVPMRVSPLTLP